MKLRLWRIFHRRGSNEKINRWIATIPGKILSLTRFFLDFDVIFQVAPGIKIPPHCLVISNHQSILDIPLMVYCFPENNVRFAAKQSLFHFVPLVSQVLRMQRHAKIDRKGRFSRTMKDLERLAREAAAGLSPVIFPEGTRSRTGKVGPFHSGAVRKIETLTPLPILSVALNGGYKSSKLREVLGTLRGKRYLIRVLNLYPPPAGKAEVEALLSHVQEEIKQQVYIWQEQEKKKI